MFYAETQNIGQRGHNETTESDSKGNFLGKLELIAKHIPNIIKKINAVGKAKYTSADIHKSYDGAAVMSEMYPDAPRELQQLSDTRWACRYFACRYLMDRFPAVV